MNTLYFVPMGDAVYWSTDLIEITDFAAHYGLLGYVDESHQVSFEIPNVICIHKFS